MLDEIAGGKWTNLSIPRGQGLKLLSRGEKALLEEIDLQQRMIELLTQEKLQLQEQMTQSQNEARTKENQLAEERGNAESRLATELRIATRLQAEMATIDSMERLEERITTCTVRIRELAQNASGERLVNGERHYLEALNSELQSRDLEELKMRRQKTEIGLSQVESRRKRDLLLIADLDQKQAALRSTWQRGEERLQRITKEINWCRTDFKADF
jgi:hypothetical protein